MRSETLDTFPRASPCLEVDGEVIAQSGAIIRYCGKLAGLYPEADLDAASLTNSSTL